MTSNNKITTLAVLGAGYVGLTTAAILAHCGYKVYLVEPNSERLRVIKSGKSFFYEKGLDSLIKLAIESKDLVPTNSYEEAIAECSVVFSCVGTPDNPDGSSNLTYVFEAVKMCAQYAQSPLVYAQKSTVPVGTGRKIEARFKEFNANVSYVSNPEFLREGTAIYDTLYFDRVVVGGDSTPAINTVLKIYMDIEQFRDHIAHISGIKNGSRENQYITTSLNSAELIKVTSNAFLALKISFANSIAILADKTSADVTEVMNAVGADSRIGQAFLSAGRGYGGGCFPKDVSGLISSGYEHGVDLEIMRAAQHVNESMPSYIVAKLQDKIGESLKAKNIAVLGLAFKAGTSDVRKSPGIVIANLLHKAGANVATYDPQAHKEAALELLPGIRQMQTISEATHEVDAIIITTEWQDILDYPASEFAKNMKGDLLLDAVNQFNALDARNAGLVYIGVGHEI